MRGQISEAKRHQSPPLEPDEIEYRGYRSQSHRGKYQRNAWDQEEGEMLAMLRDLPERLACLESLQER